VRGAQCAVIDHATLDVSKDEPLTLDELRQSTRRVAAHLGRAPGGSTADSVRRRTLETYDLIIIGGGHNALECAAYMTRAGKSVLVVERNDWPDGFVRTDEIMPSCDQCARAVWQVRSTHRTSAGEVGYAHCPCGAWLVLLDGRPLATARPRPRAATPPVPGERPHGRRRLWLRLWDHGRALRGTWRRQQKRADPPRELSL
jgi:choline dehydrogenase-like flavoprotein